MYQGLRFSFSQMEREIDNLAHLATEFLTVESSHIVIPNWKRDLLNFKSAPTGTKMMWEISEAEPVQTDVSVGEYEAGDRNGQLAVFGRVSGVWEIRLPEEVKKKHAESKEFVLLGLASVKITIWDAMEEPNKEIARWTIEVGDAVSPGCHFHTQIDLDPDDNKFPKALCVPRLPGLLHTPMDALEFLLGELFQDRWLQVASTGGRYCENLGQLPKGASDESFGMAKNRTCQLHRLALDNVKEAKTGAGYANTRGMMTGKMTTHSKRRLVKIGR